jgi:hypothetical protein
MVTPNEREIFAALYPSVGYPAESGEEEEKRGWADVLGLGLWGLWSPPLESAT